MLVTELLSGQNGNDTSWIGFINSRTWQGTDSYVVSPSLPWLLTQDMNDYLNCVKLSPYTIIVLERSELCHWISGLPGFVHYPKNTLIPLTSSVKHARSSSKKLRTKENHVSTTAVKEQQHGGKSELLASAAAHNSGTVQSFPNHLVSGGESQTLSSHMYR